jgi:hypothetical protein
MTSGGTLWIKPELKLGHSSTLPNFAPLDAEVRQLVDLGLGLLKDLATKLSEVGVYLRRNSKGCTQRLHIAPPGRLPTMQPKRS